MPKIYKRICIYCHKEYKGEGKKYCSKTCYFNDPNTLVKMKKGKMPEATKIKLSIAKKGCVPWNKGKKWSIITRRRISDAVKGRIPWNKGISRTDEEKEKISANHADVSGTKNPNFGRGERIEGKNNPNWHGGIAFFPYTEEFKPRIKRCIRERDQYQCILCKKEESSLNRKLEIHHIDYDKKNCSEKNLVSLCRSCHGKTNYKRDYWRLFFINNYVKHLYPIS